MLMSQQFPGTYLKSADILALPGQQILLTISTVQTAKLGDDVKPTMNFYECAQGMVVNKTNGELMIAAFGDDVAGWPGKQVTLYVHQTQKGPGIAVVIPAQAAVGVVAPVTVAAAPVAVVAPVAAVPVGAPLAPAPVAPPPALAPGVAPTLAAAVIPAPVGAPVAAVPVGAPVGLPPGTPVLL